MRVDANISGLGVTVALLLMQIGAKTAVVLTITWLEYVTVLLSWCFYLCIQRRTGKERSSRGNIDTQSDRPD